MPVRGRRPSRKRKLAVLARDGYACVVCGKTERLTVDHIVPRSKGGQPWLANLQTLCKDHNRQKGDNTSLTWDEPKPVPIMTNVTILSPDKLELAINELKRRWGAR